jgi:MFS superfamily sulfate permease-like transporter
VFDFFCCKILLHVAGLDHFSLYNDFILGINCLLNLIRAGQTYVIFACLFFLTIVIISYFSFMYRLGWLIRFISQSVISGFTTASAIAIGLSQIKYFLGYSITRSSKIIPLIESIIAGINWFVPDQILLRLQHHKK